MFLEIARKPENVEETCTDSGRTFETHSNQSTGLNQEPCNPVRWQHYMLIHHATSGIITSKAKMLSHYIEREREYKHVWA